MPDRGLTLMQTSEDIYDMLRFGTSISQGIGQQHKAVHFIDWKHPRKNTFEIAEEVTVKSDGVGMYDHVRPDIVVYVNCTVVKNCGIYPFC